jgi:hypothetical protein
MQRPDRVRPQAVRGRPRHLASILVTSVAGVITFVLLLLQTPGAVALAPPQPCGQMRKPPNATPAGSVPDGTAG